MPEIVCGKLTQNFVFDCENISTGGIGQYLKLVNKSDIDYVTSTTLIDDTNHKVTNIGLKAGATVVTVQSLPNKRLASVTSTPTDTEYGMFFNHQVKFPALGLSEEHLIALRDLTKGGVEVVAIVKDNYKGSANQDAFKVYGWSNGLKLIEAPYDSNANNGNIPIILGTKEPDLEPLPPLVYFKTDAATTQSSFDAL